jgi:two-component sensor histidine kinase
MSEESWEGAEIHDILTRTLEPHAGPERLRMQGPPIRLVPKAALAISMAMHELATNAVKYGPLSNGTGRIAVIWSVDGTDPGTLNLRWTETGGPIVAPPARKGFGSRLIERNLAYDLDGEVKIDYRPEGVVCTIVSSLEAAGETVT